jgi:dolichol-phosphate mannosyltransferase
MNRNQFRSSYHSTDRGFSAVQAPKVRLVLPAYNEEASLFLLLESAGYVLAGMPDGGSVYVVDDGSTDSTADIVLTFAGQGVELISHERNRGLHQAVRTGFVEALKDMEPDGVIVAMDADNTHHPSLIPHMLERIAAGADVVIASRFAPGGKMIGAPLVRRLYSLGARTLLSLRFPSCGARDFTCGYRAYRVATLRKAFDRWGDDFINVPGFACMLDILLRLHTLGARIEEVPLVLRYDLKESPSKLRVLRTIRNTLKLLGPRRD